MCSLNSGGLLANLIIQQAIYVSKFLGLLEHLLILKDTLCAKHWLDIFHILYFGTEKKNKCNKIECMECKGTSPFKELWQDIELFLPLMKKLN